VTPRELRALRREAAEAGDLEQVRLCERALDGDPAAVLACRRAIDEAEAAACGLALAHPLATLALARIEQIGAEAAERGDTRRMLIAARALSGDLEALTLCAEIARGRR